MYGQYFYIFINKRTLNLHFLYITDSNSEIFKTNKLKITEPVSP